MHYQPTSSFPPSLAPSPSSPQSEKIRIDFEAGVPVKVTNHDDGTVKTDALELFLYLNDLAGKHGVGRIDIVENRFVGIKSRGVYETPGGQILRVAHMDLEGLCIDREVMRLKEGHQLEFARLCYNGFWFAPEMELTMAAIDWTQKHVKGGVELSLYKGNVTVLGRESPFSLYSADLASMEIEGGGSAFDYDPMDAQGFIRINGVRLKAYNALQRTFEK